MNAMKPQKPWNDPTAERSAMLAVRRIYPKAVLRGVDGKPYRWKIVSEVVLNGGQGAVLSEGRDLSDVCNTTEEAWLMAANRLKGRK